MALIKKKDGKPFGVKRIGVTYLVKLENEAPVNENAVEETVNVHKRATLCDGTVKAKRSGNSIKAHHRYALMDFLVKSEQECNAFEPCKQCLACAIHGFSDFKKTKAMHSSIVSFSDMASIQKAADCIYGREETMLKTAVGGESPQPFGYERVKAGTHFVGTAYLTLTGRKTPFLCTFASESQVVDAFWYGMRAVLANQTYQQTVMSARHDARLTPEMLVVSEVRALPAETMVTPDLTVSSTEEMVKDLESRAKAAGADLSRAETKLGEGNTITVLKGEAVARYLAERGRIRETGVVIEYLKKGGEQKEKEEK